MSKIYFAQRYIKEILTYKEHIKRNTIIQIVIATLAFILLMRIYPFSVVQKHTDSKPQTFDMSNYIEIAEDVFTSNDKRLQTVSPTNSHLYKLKLYMGAVLSSTGADDTVMFVMYDDSFTSIYSEEYNVSKIAHDGYLSVMPDIDVETGRLYYYEIIVPSDCSAQIWLPTASRGELNQPENGALFVDGIVNNDICLVAEFDYLVGLSFIECIVLYVLIIAVTLVLYLLVMAFLIFYDREYSAHSRLIVKHLKILLSVILIAAGIFVIFFSVILNKFGSPVLDRIVYLIAVVSGLMFGLVAIWRSDYYLKAKKESSRSLMWENYIQTVCFGLLFYALCQYVNAYWEYYHMINTRWMLIFLSIAFLMILKARNFINKYSVAWLILGWGCSAVYCHGFKNDGYDFLMARLTCGVIVSWGLFVLNLVLVIVKSGIVGKISAGGIRMYIVKHKLSSIYFMLWVLFAILMYVYRYEKVWVFTATLPFAALLFVRLTPQAKSRFLKNFTNGILLSFALVTFFCLLHRPHHYWRLYRYAGIFHTVACMGVYLAMVFAAAVGKLYGRLKDRKNIIIRCLYEYFIAGCVSGFIILTMSRTAFVTAAVVMIAVLVLSIIAYKKKLKRVMQELSVFVVSAIACFFIMFSAVRMIPAVVNDPVRYDIELQDDSFMICKGDPIDSDKYITIGRFFDMLFGRFKSESDDDIQAGVYISNEETVAYIGNDIATFNMENMENTDVSETSVEASNDISNGRFEIFKAYISNLGLQGHPGMEATSQEGIVYGHAHNSYLQISYNFGIIAGVAFLAMIIIALFRGADMIIKQGRKHSIYFVPFALVVAFSVVSLTEWAFHPCIPVGFAFMLVQVVLIKE
jgi:hypothetical protein